jgi:hypothetical protein
MPRNVPKVLPFADVDFEQEPTLYQREPTGSAQSDALFRIPEDHLAAGAVLGVAPIDDGFRCIADAIASPC